MHKDELLQLHSLLCQMKRYFEDSGLPVDGEFVEYDGLNCSPQHIHKSKLQHKRAVFLLGKELAEALGGVDELSNTHKIGLRLSDLAKKATPKPAFAPPTSA